MRKSWVRSSHFPPWHIVVNVNAVIHIYVGVDVDIDIVERLLQGFTKDRFYAPVPSPPLLKIEMTGIGIWHNADRQYLHKVRAGYESEHLFKTLIPSLSKRGITLSDTFAVTCDCE